MSDRPPSLHQPMAGVAVNPYTAPRAHLLGAPSEVADELAGRGDRLMAISLDGLLGLPIGLLVAAGVFLGPETPTAFVLYGAAALATIALVVVQWMQLSERGQTLGKRWMNVQIVRMDGSKAGMGRLVGLRWIVPSVIGGIPFVGGLFSLADALFIFGDARRCLHDYIADTKVVVYRGS